MFKPNFYTDFIDFIGFPDKKITRKFAGVYNIADVYVGASTHIRSRLICHFRQMQRGTHSRKELNELFTFYQSKSLLIPVTLESQNPFDEKEISQRVLNKVNSYERFYDSAYNIVNGKLKQGKKKSEKPFKPLVPVLNFDINLIESHGINEFETWLLLHIKISEKHDNQSLCERTGWEIEKLLKIKKSLLDKKILFVKQMENGNSQFEPNYYGIKINLFKDI